MGFYQMLESGMNRSVTENGAAGFFTSGSKLVDLNFAASSMRSMNSTDIERLYRDAYKEDPENALRWLFFLRDIRGGMGERQSFRTILQWLAGEYPAVTEALLDTYADGEPLIAHYGRWDDLLCLLPYHEEKVLQIIRDRLAKDIDAMGRSENVSLLAKWLPSVNTSSKGSRALAKEIAMGIGMSERAYRKTLSKLRRYMNVTETQMSANAWESINYNAVPSKANLLYGHAFMRHDEERRAEWLRKLASGDRSVKVNANAAFPYDVVHALSVDKNAALYDAMWKEIVENIESPENTIVVCDGSGSMFSPAGSKTNVTAFEVAASLAIAFSERMTGEFHDKFITFSHRPQLVDLSECKTLSDKVNVVEEHGEIADTNIEAVFDLILAAAVKNHVSQNEMPTCVLILSDMEFNKCASCNTMSESGGWYVQKSIPDTLFEVIADRYRDAGYKLPKLAFWNICSRTRTIPVTENENGVILLSGFSPSAVKMVLSGKYDPLEALLCVLGEERYAPVVSEKVRNALRMKTGA